MIIEQRTVYISDDGKEFDKEQDCKYYEKSLNLQRIIVEHIERFGKSYYDIDTKEDIAKAIADTFDAILNKYNKL